MPEDPRNIQESNQAFSHKLQQGDKAAHKCSTIPTKKRKMERGPHNIAIPFTAKPLKIGPSQVPTP